MTKDKGKKKSGADVQSDTAAEENIKAEQPDAAVNGEQSAPEPEEGGLFLTKKELKQAQEKIVELRKSCDEAIADAQRIQAEFNNYRKRNASIRSESLDEGVRETITNLLPVLDNFDRALLNAEDTPFAKGMIQINKQLMDVLAKCGLEKVKDDGQFDPELHEAVLRDEEGEAESGAITAVLQTGYSVRGKIIRHTMVKVKV